MLIFQDSYCKVIKNGSKENITKDSGQKAGISGKTQFIL
jgi:hypothetical protein